MYIRMHTYGIHVQMCMYTRKDYTGLLAPWCFTFAIRNFAVLSSRCWLDRERNSCCCSRASTPKDDTKGWYRETRRYNEIAKNFTDYVARAECYAENSQFAINVGYALVRSSKERIRRSKATSESRFTAEQRARKSCAARIISFPSPLPPPGIISSIIVSGRTILPRFNSLLIVIGLDRVYRRFTRPRRCAFVVFLTDGLDARLRIRYHWCIVEPARTLTALLFLSMNEPPNEWGKLPDRWWPIATRYRNRILFASYREHVRYLTHWNESTEIVIS